MALSRFTSPLTPPSGRQGNAVGVAGHGGCPNRVFRYAVAALEPEGSLVSKRADQIAWTIVLFEAHPDRVTTHPFFVHRSVKANNVTGRIYYERLRSG